MRNHSYENDFDLHENETVCATHRSLWQTMLKTNKIDEALLAAAEQGRAQALRPVGGGFRGVRTNPLWRSIMED